MKLKNIRSHIIKTLGDIGVYFMIFGLFGIIVVPSVIGIFSDTDNYINNSETVILKPYDFIAEINGVDYGFSARKDVFIIKSNNIHYSLSYYRKNKTDYGAFFSFPRNKHEIFIKVNRLDLIDYQGSYEDPIPVFNFSFDGEKYIWDEESYQYNVERYYVREKILKSKFYTNIVELILLIGFIMFVPTIIFNFKKKSK